MGNRGFIGTTLTHSTMSGRWGDWIETVGDFKPFGCWCCWPTALDALADTVDGGFAETNGTVMRSTSQGPFGAMGRGAANAFDGSDGKGFVTYCGTSWRGREVESRPSLAKDCSSKD